MSSDQKRIMFTQEQIEWLERMYPEVTGNYPEDELRYRAGQRNVLARIKQECHVEVRLVPVQRSVPQ
jgi:hypothetical protein